MKSILMMCCAVFAIAFLSAGCTPDESAEASANETPAEDQKETWGANRFGPLEE
jgi:hypothetical protein